jgi:acyl carrier protein
MPMKSEVRKQVMELILGKLQRLSISENELGDSFDMVKSGLVNSLEFVDLVASLEKINHHEIDFEKALDSGELTTLGGLIRAFENNK